ncbi:DUF308 domain-containing protein [Roseibacterium sp. SDUM158016]|uniref:HdeD family acid-resistance protein n=1 Tax=Roseicyclus sediminis TaxID=2980997 RepID=UPI0021D1B75D|nr:DUF308 domain-containing protein [Roseibacterium sp. SDUM158016]MCU4654786.1 DUF308 domain-containing protein [Roseibacterium sp. SDUM158016]
MTPWSPAAAHPGFGIRSSLGWLAGGFILLGVLSILAPAAATLAATVLVGLAMLFWGGLGLWMSLSLRAYPEWKLAASGFGLVAGLGVVFLVFPRLGIEAMTLLVVAGFLIEGVFSILFGLRLSPEASGWGWMVASGVAALAVGLILLIGWPGTATWLLGLMLGMNFLTTGAALLAVRGTIRTEVR